MKAPTDLFDLIQSLSASEKRYLQLQGSTSNNADYIQLFEVINKQEEYNEEKIKKHFAKKPFIKRLPAVKDYLYQFILKSLASYHTGVDSELNNQLHHIDILFQKGLYKHCESLVSSAKKLAQKHENHIALAELLFWEIELMRIQAFYGKTQLDVKETSQNLNRCLEKYHNRLELYHVAMQLTQKIKKGMFMRNATDLQFFKTMTNHPLLSNENQAQGYHAKNYFYLSHFLLSSIQNNPVKGYPYTQKQVRLIEANAHQIDENPALYAGALTNLSMLQHLLKDYKSLEQSLTKLNGIDTNKKSMSHYIFLSSHIIELRMHAETVQINKALQLIGKIEQELEQFSDRESKNPMRLFMYYMMGVNYFIAGNFSSTKKYLNKIILNNPEQYNTDLHGMTLIFQLLIHFELGNDDVLESFVKSTYRFLYKSNRIYKFENIILDFIKKTARLNHSKKEIIPALHLLKKELEEIAKDPFENRPMEYFDYISWLESKIEDRSFSEVLREKAGRFVEIKKQAS